MPAPRLRERRLTPEIMDREDLDPADHHHALNGIARINLISASSGIFWPPIRDLCRQRQKADDPNPVRILDIATGGGDVACGLWRRASHEGFRVAVAGCDISPLALDHAGATAARLEAEVSFFQLNILTDPIPAGYDVVMCSLFLHHLTEDQAVSVLRKMGDAAGTIVLVNDLARGWLGWLAARIGTRVLTRSKTVHFDGVVSVEGAFTPDEALELAHRAGWNEATVKRKFPFRYLLSWRRP
jgi:2-polyprenyl-3-methyl-5-hydroxy-6-metoxy-1,4-benzoquinol methylase